LAIKQVFEQLVRGNAIKSVSCHMPMTGFARLNRSDHSMLPPTPAAYNLCILTAKDRPMIGPG